MRQSPIFFKLERIEDERGWLMELFRQDQLCQEDWPRMAYVSETKPGVVRGAHSHVSQADLFVFVGPGDFELHLWDLNEHARNQKRNPGMHFPIENSKLAVNVFGESQPFAVLVPPGVVHGYKCVSDHPGWVFNFPNKMYGGAGKKYLVDEIRHEETPKEEYGMAIENPFVIE